MPFALTVDFKSLEDATVTVRERDSTAQVRAWSLHRRACSLHTHWQTSWAHPTCCVRNQLHARVAHNMMRLPTCRGRAQPHLAPQIRVPVADVAGVIRRLVVDGAAWAEVSAAYPAEERPAADEQQ